MLQETMWRTYDGREIPISELTDDHLWNIIKYLLEFDNIPITEILIEARERGFLSEISKLMPMKTGYKSPDEIRKLVRKDTISDY